LYPDPKARLILGWQIRWVASLFALLMFAAGAVPAYAAESEEGSVVEQSVQPLAGADDESASASEPCDPTDGIIGPFAKTSWEPEVQEEETDSSPAAIVAPLVFVLETGSPARDDVRTLRSTRSSGRLSSRAPPLA